MPIGPPQTSDYVISAAIFGSIKLIGYMLIVFPLALGFEQPQMKKLKNVAIFGIIRLILGIITFLAAYLFLTRVHLDSERFYYIGIFPVRVMEWMSVIWYFFDRKAEKPFHIIGCALFGTIFSYLLDLGGVMTLKYLMIALER